MRTAALLAATIALLAVTPAVSAQTYHLPWPAGQGVFVTQDCNDSCCGDHVGFNAYAWDFAVEGSFEVLAPRAGTLVHVKMSSNHGGDASEVDAANYVVIDHGDGTASVFLHLAYGSLARGLHCGDFVRAGQRIATTGSTGWSSGNHLHYQVNRIPANMPRVCECGADGMACGENEAHWDLFWSRNEESTSVPVSFEEWRGASACGDRHDDNVQVSRNYETRNERVASIDENEPGRFTPLAGAWSVARGGANGSFRQAAPGNAAAALSFEGRVPGAGVYEVWAALPANGRNVGASSAHAEIVGRGQRSAVPMAQNVAGGAYHPVGTRVKLTGRPGEGLLVASSGRAGEALALDGVVLRRVADAGFAGEGARCASSTECAGELVCAQGACHAGCERSGCAAGSVCDASGMCLAGGASAVARLSVPTSPVAVVPASAETPTGNTVRGAMPRAGGGPSVMPAAAAPGPQDVRGFFGRVRSGLRTVMGALFGLVLVVATRGRS